MTSELSNALNPNAVPQRRRRSAYAHIQSHTAGPSVEQARPEAQAPQPAYSRHRSELELAVIEPPQPALPPPQQAAHVVTTQPPPNAPTPRVHNAAPVLENVVRAIVHTKQAADQERNRRLAWEQEQEAKHLQRQAEMQKELEDMKAEMALLKAVVSMQQQQQQQQPVLPTVHVVVDEAVLPAAEPPLPEPTAHIEELPANTPTPPVIAEPQPVHGMDPRWNFPDTHSLDTRSPYIPAFIEGSSSRPLSGPPHQPYANNQDNALSPGMLSPLETGYSPSMLSPGSATMSDSASAAPSPSAVPRRKRKTSRVASSPHSSSDESDAPADGGPRKRRNGHDTRCLTIQAAIRSHIYRCMASLPNGLLPDSFEGDSIRDEDPVRFDWSKTTRKSSHNTRMKKRVLADLVANRATLYKYVPERDFDPKVLDAGFDQAFTTMRQKFRTQQDEIMAQHNRAREEQKALKARRKDRKKSKLASRTDSRTRLPVFLHPAFDGALQLDCMSSEESESEYTASAPTGELNRVRVLRVRGLVWRSTRLLRFYAALDAAQPPSPSASPCPSPVPFFSGQGHGDKKKRKPAFRKERCLGPAKDGLILPPQGVSSWMVSQRWLRECELAGQQEVIAQVRELVDDEAVASLNWETFDALGSETEEEEPEPSPEPYIPRSDTSYALANALQAPV